jgi:hypothetical protein
MNTPENHTVFKPPVLHGIHAAANILSELFFYSYIMEGVQRGRYSLQKMQPNITALTPILRPRIGKYQVESVSLRYMP